MHSCSTLFSKYLDVMAVEDVNLSSDKTKAPLWSNETDSDFCHQHTLSAVVISTTRSFHVYIGLSGV
jgi:hypothetical protein